MGAIFYIPLPRFQGNLRGHIPSEKSAFGGLNVGTVVFGWHFPRGVMTQGSAADPLKE